MPAKRRCQVSERRGIADLTPIITRSEDETIALARDFAASLSPGSVVLLFGDLGAGKTAFVRGLALGLGLDPEAVSSPTFTLIQEYRGSPSLCHVDLYRLNAAEAADLGLDELWAGGAVVAIEWAEKMPDPPPGAWTVRLEDRGDDLREVRIDQMTGIRDQETSAS
jgi:tRNA threonylcarbamoyladenosine biosynthesis protein TsaE